MKKLIIISLAVFNLAALAQLNAVPPLQEVDLQGIYYNSNSGEAFLGLTEEGQLGPITQFLTEPTEVQPLGTPLLSGINSEPQSQQQID